MPVANLSHPLVPACDVLINGQAWTAAEKAHVVSVTVSQSLDKAAMVTFELCSPVGHSRQPLWIDDLERFAIGNEVEVKLGYAGALETMIVGDIASLAPTFTGNRLPRVTVVGYDRRYRMQQGKNTHTFTEKKDSDIVAELAKKAGLTAETTDSQVIHPYLQQTNESDWQFLAARAQKIKYEVKIEGKTLLFRPVANAASAAFTLFLAQDLLDFHPRLAASGQVTEVIVSGWDPKEKKTVLGRAQAGDGEAAMGGQQRGSDVATSAFGATIYKVSSSPVLSQTEADQQAKALLNQRLLGLVSGTGACFGRTDLRPGLTINIEGVGKLFSGPYYVTNATHSYSPQGSYRTNFSIQRNAV